MLRYKISIDLAEVALAANSAVNEQVFPLLNQAVNAVAQQTRANWMEAVYRAKLWSGEKDAYANSISLQMTGPFSAVVESDYKHAHEIETGRPPRDLKKMLNTSHKVRRTKDGRRFLVIPFRHNIPGNEALAPAMPQQVYDVASKLIPSMVVSTGQRRAGEITATSKRYGMAPLGEKRQRRSPYLTDIKTRGPAMVTKRNYQWGERLGNEFGNRYAGMVRFDTSAGGKRYSTYMTFRTMMEGSSGWIVPAKPGLYLAKKVADEMRPLAEKVFREAVRRSLA